jgi:hypothetical protein
MNLRQAAQQALEAMACMRDMVAHPDNLQFIDNAITALRTALAEPEQEPPPKMRLLPCCGYHDGRAVFWNRFNGVVQCHSCGQQYAPHPPQRKPLTDEEIDDIWNRYCDELGEASINDAHDIARAIERAHGIGGEA